MAIPTVKSEACRFAKEILIEVPFASIYSSANTLFEKKELPHASPDLETEINFLKKTKLSEIQFEDINNIELFRIKNTTTGDSIPFSNRDSNNKELRGESLRQLINNTENKDQFAYDFLSKAIKDPASSDQVAGVKAMLVGEKVAENGFYQNNDSMPEAQFNLFTRIFLQKLNQKIEAGEVNGNQNAKDFRYLPHEEDDEIKSKEAIRNEILKGIDVEAIYDETYQFVENLQALETKAKQLDERGYHSAAIEAQTLHTRLIKAIDSYASGAQNEQQFKAACISTLDTAEHGELHKHRNLFSRIISAIKQFLGYESPTDSIKKMKDIKESLGSIIDSEQPEENKENIEKSAQQRKI